MTTGESTPDTRTQGATARTTKGDIQPADSAFDLQERLLDYAARIVRLVEGLPKTRPGTHVAAQLPRSGTSPLANHAEAQAAESGNDFVHKMRICLKELRETQRWLLLCQKVPLIRPPSKLDPLLRETGELIAIFYASIRTVKSRNMDGPSSRTGDRARGGLEC